MYQKQNKGLYLTIPKSDVELLHIAKMYASQNPEGFLPVDLTKSVIEFKKALHGGSFLRLIMKDDIIHGFIGGLVGALPHVAEKTVQQLYYYCDLEGLEAFRAVVLAHESLVNYAEGLKAKYVLSACSQFYKNDNFVRILATQGWEVFGYVAIWKTSHNLHPSRPIPVRSPDVGK